MLLIAGMGYVGSALAARWQDAGGEVLGLRRSTAPGCLSVDLSDEASLAQALANVRGRVDRLVYCAAADGRTPEAYRKAYVQGFGTLLKVLGDAPLERVIFTSSTAVYGQGGGQWVDEESETVPSGFTGEMLLEAESLLPKDIGVSLRLAGIYGPGRTRLVRMVAEGKAAAEERYTNRIHRDDCAGALQHLLRLPSVERCYVGVDDAPVLLSEVRRFLGERLGVAVEDPAGEADNKRLSNRRLRESGYTFEFPSFREGYPAIVEEFLANR